MSAPAAADLAYALLIGQGRSGTNYLLGLLDQSAHTHCRNEPDQLDRSALARLAPFRFVVDDEAELGRLYDGAVRQAARCLGPRDHLTEVDKAWIRPGRRRLGYFLLRQRIRAVERLVHWRKPMDGKEHVFPRWMVDPAALARSTHVFKLNAAVGYGGWALRARAGARVIQIVRHPGGFAKSWLKRWVHGEGGQQRGRGNADRWQDEERLREVARRDPRWAARFGDIERMERFEGELWWWRWVNETLLEAGGGRPNHCLVLYEDLTREPERITRGVYEFLGLSWSAEIAARVAALSRGAESIARAWKDELDPAHVATVERVLHGSPMETWWTRTEAPRAAA
jgi:Sulfotransferase family